MRKSLPLLFLLLAGLWLAPPRATPQQHGIVAGARSCLGDVYDSQRYQGGPPPRGKGACTDVVWRACLPFVDLQEAVARDRAALGEPVDRDLDYRWCPFLIRWFERHAIEARDFQPGDVVFWFDDLGVPYHTGVVSDRRAWDGNLLVIHNGGPVCGEDNRLRGGGVERHFRLRHAVDQLGGRFRDGGPEDRQDEQQGCAPG